VCRFVPPAGRGMPPTLACQPGCTSNSQCADAAGSVCDSNGYCVECADNSTCSGATPVCNANLPYPFRSPTYETCVVCLPPAYGSDAGSQGCDGAMCVLVGRGPGASYTCQ
jgi:hypothetical protein